MVRRFQYVSQYVGKSVSESVGQRVNRVCVYVCAFLQLRCLLRRPRSAVFEFFEIRPPPTDLDLNTHTTI